MKRLKDEQLNAFVNYYLEKRNYFNTNQNKIARERSKRRCLSVKEMVTSNIVDNCGKTFPINGQLPIRDCDIDISNTITTNSTNSTSTSTTITTTNSNNNNNSNSNHNNDNDDDAYHNNNNNNSFNHNNNYNNNVNYKWKFDGGEKNWDDFASSLTNNISKEERDLDDAFEQLQQLPPCIPGPCIGYLEGGNPCSVDIRKDIKYFAAGFANSEINLWSLTALGFKNDKQFANCKSSSALNPLRLAFDPDLIYHHITNPIECSSSASRILSSSSSMTTPMTMTTTAATTITSTSTCQSSRQHSTSSGEKTLSGASILRGHYGPVYGLNFVENSHHLISCSEDTTIRLWDLNCCKNEFVYSGHLYPVWCIDSSPLELYFVSGSRDTTARLWTYERLYPLRIFTGHILDVDVVKFHPNTAYIATGSSDKTIRFWELKSGQMVRLLEGHKSRVNCLAFSPDGKYLVSGGDDCAIKVWDLRTDKGPLFGITAHRAPVDDVAFNGDGSVLISASSDRTVKFWDFKSFKERENSTTKHLLHSTSTDLSMIKLKMLPLNVLYIHGRKPG